MSRFSYQKWEATGNDFVIVDLSLSNLTCSDFSPRFVRTLCDRKQGIGADGVVLLDRSEKPLVMTIINSDGSPSGMCGNALRCVAQILAQSSGEASGSVALGDRVVKTRVDEFGTASALLGEPRAVPGRHGWESDEKLDETLGLGYLIWFGNPHHVVPVERLPENWIEAGQKAQEIADHRLNTGGINCGFVERQAHNGVHRLRVYERGAGVTQSCGSGACAASAVLELLGVAPPHRLELLGGVVTVGRDPEGYTLSGPARLEFEGEWAS